MEKVKIGNYVKQIRGVSYKPNDLHNNLNSDSVILLRANNINEGKINFDDIVYVDKSKVKKEQYLKKGDILVCASSGSKELVGKAAFINKDYAVTFGAFCKLIRPKDCIAGYLGHYFNSQMYKEKISSLALGANINNIRNEHIDELLIYLPNKAEQQNISILLYEVSDLTDKRKKQLEKLDELVKARFVEMFGDPMCNTKNYELSTYGNFFELNAGGTPSKQKNEYWDDGNISWIGSNMCQNAVIYENDGKYITQAGYDNSSARLFSIDTVLIALVGATIGKTALLKFETTTNQNVLGVRGIVESGNNPYFVFYYTQGLHRKFLNIGDGGFNMASKDFVSKLPFPFVEIKLQNRFAAFVKQIDKSKFEIKQSLEKLELLKKALMQKYFG